MELTTLLDKTVSFEAGLITYLSEVPMQVNEAQVHIYIAEFQDPTVLCDVAVKRMPPSSRQASGAGLDRDEALWSTLGEAIERYAASNWMHLTQTEAVADDLPGARDFLERAIFFSNEDYADPDFGFAKPDPEKKRYWLEGASLLTKTPSYVPASTTCMNYEAQYPHEILDRSYSTGLASHTTYEAAILSGLCEVVERDAYCSYWLSQTAPEVLDGALLQTLAPKSLLSELKRLGLEYRVFAMRTDVEVPVIVSCIKIEGGGIATGASCHMNSETAVTKAIVESMHTYNWCLDMKRLGNPFHDKFKIDDFPDHVSYYLDPEKADNYLWWEDEPRLLHELPPEWVTNTGTAPEQLAALVKSVAKSGHDPIWTDLTSPDMADLGFVIVKAFVAGFQPLSAGYLSPQTDPRRISEFAKYVGIDWNGTISLDPPHAFP